MGLKKDTFGKTKESKTDFTLASRDAKLQAEYVKNQEQRNLRCYISLFNRNPYRMV